MNTRQLILEATKRVIQAKGLARTTTKEIAREAGYSEATLYKHFDYKEEVFLALLRENLPHFMETLRLSQAGTRTVRANLEEIAHAAMCYYEQIIPLAASLFADTELLARHREWMRERNGGPQRIYQHVTTYVEAEQHLGRIDRQLSPFSVAALLLGSCFQYVFFRQFLGENPFAITDQQFIPQLVGTLAEGLLPQEE